MIESLLFFIFNIWVASGDSYETYQVHVIDLREDVMTACSNNVHQADNKTLACIYQPDVRKIYIWSLPFYQPNRITDKYGCESVLLHEYYHAMEDEVWWNNGAKGDPPDWHDGSKRENNQKYCNNKSKFDFL